MKILHTESSCGWGGQELRILTESEGMRRRGHEVVLVAPPESRIVPAARERGLEVHALPMGRKSLKGFLCMRDWLSRHPVDVVNTHSSTDSWLVALARATLRDAPPIVRTRHISAPVPRNATTRWLYQSATHSIVTTGETLRATLARDNGYDPARMVSVPTGIDTARFAPGDRPAARAALGLPAGKLLVGIVATLRSWKGHRYLIDAFASLEREDALLLVVGDGPQEANLRAQVASLGLGDRVRLCGNQADVRPWLHALDVFALPSYANEGVPQSLVQAMLSGLPCISTPVGSIAEAAIDGQTALMVPPEDTPALATALGRLLDDASLRECLGAAARAHCAARFSLEAMLDAMERVFADAAMSAKAPGA